MSRRSFKLADEVFFLEPNPDLINTAESADDLIIAWVAIEDHDRWLAVRNREIDPPSVHEIDDVAHWLSEQPISD